MKVGVIVLCRYSSNRLPGKILKVINGKPILAYIIERLKMSQLTDEIIIATSTEHSDNIISEYCSQNNINCFRGDLNNVAKRFLDCAESNKLDYAIRINGDNLWIDSTLLDSMITIAKTNAYDFISNVKGRTYPIGISIEILNTDFYRNILKQIASDHYKEHVTLYLYEHAELANSHFVYNDKIQSAKNIKLAIDDEKDFKFAQSIMSAMEKDHTHYGFKEIIKIIAKLKSE